MSKSEPTIHHIHLLPLTNTEEHNENENCWCNPRIESVGANVKLHIHQTSGQDCCIVKKNMGWAKIDFMTT